MIRKRKIFIIILIILSAYVIVVDADNYFNGGLSEHRAYGHTNLIKFQINLPDGSIVDTNDFQGSGGFTIEKKGGYGLSLLILVLVIISLLLMWKYRKSFV